MKTIKQKDYLRVPAGYTGKIEVYQHKDFEPSNKLELWLIVTCNGGKLHSFDDEPAASYLSDPLKGKKIWYKNGKLHRGNGRPAVINDFGYKKYYEYWIDGEQVTRKAAQVYRDLFKEENDYSLKEVYGFHEND